MGVALMCFYVVAASEHGRRINTSKARGDQSGYLWDAENVYANWHGRHPPTVIGERNRMPLYAGYLALFYHPSLSDQAFFEVAKRANIYLSLVLLVGLSTICFRELPRLPAANLTGIVAFGYFIFKAGYAQAEVLFYFLMFLTFLGCWHLLRGVGGVRGVSLAIITGVVAGLGQLTKAAMLPFIAMFLAAYAASVIAGGSRGRTRHPAEARTAGTAWPVLSVLAVIIAFSAVLWPYLSTSKRVFGEYFYNVNSTFYVWYDDWAHASVGTYAHGDGIGWPTLPASELPGPARYWREHDLGQIAARLGSGFEDLALKSYQMFGYLPYLILYSGMFALIVATRRSAVREMIREHTWLVAFLVVYAAVYLLAIAFYCPTSGTGTGRFLLAHLLPLFFVLSRVFSSDRLKNMRWIVAGIPLALADFHRLVTAVLALDIAFRLWPRLMSTYGGF